MKRIGGGVGFQGDAVVVQGPAAVLVGEVLVDLAVGQQLAPLQGGEVEVAEPLAKRRVGAAMRSPEAGKEAAARLGGRGRRDGGAPLKARVSCGEGGLLVKARGRRPGAVRRWGTLG